MTSSSPLGAAIEAAVSSNPAFEMHREPVKYLCYFRTLAGRVFAFERTTKSQITLWLPEDAKVRATAEAQGLSVMRSEPFQDTSDRSKYGRISSLSSEPQLKDAVLYRIPVNTVAQAAAVLGALS
jgi:hypothetical protein